MYVCIKSRKITLNPVRSSLTGNTYGELRSPMEQLIAPVMTNDNEATKLKHWNCVKCLESILGKVVNPER